MDVCGGVRVAPGGGWGWVASNGIHPVPSPFSPYEGPCRFGYTRTGGARIKG